MGLNQRYLPKRLRANAIASDAHPPPIMMATLFSGQNVETP
jgi:hypothetical protein